GLARPLADGGEALGGGGVVARVEGEAGEAEAGASAVRALGRDGLAVRARLVAAAEAEERVAEQDVAARALVAGERGEPALGLGSRLLEAAEAGVGLGQPEPGVGVLRALGVLAGEALEPLGGAGPLPLAHLHEGPGVERARRRLGAGVARGAVERGDGGGGPLLREGRLPEEVVEARRVGVGV